MPIILSQRIDMISDYDDVPYNLYHFPKRYRNQLKQGDMFIYYQGDRSKRENRYYFGCGVIGSIEVSNNGEEYYAEIIEGVPFQRKVPIYISSGGFYESLGYETIRNQPEPAWRNSIRKLSDYAFHTILDIGGVTVDQLDDISEIESQTESLVTLKLLNERYIQYSPARRLRLVNAHIDRGCSVTRSLKSILGSKCQICGEAGFEKRNGEKYIEAHHITQVALNAENSLCSDNVILLCPNCHKELHFGGKIEIIDLGDRIQVRLEKRESIIAKNTIEYLTSKLWYDN